MQVSKLLKACLPWRFKLWIKARRNQEIATPTDLFYCFRLILGRDPDPEGWQTFMESIRHGSMTRTRLVRTFLESVEFAMRKSSADAMGKIPIAVDLPEFLIYVRNAESAIGQAMIHDRGYEPEVTTALRRILVPGMSFVDIGCNVGYFSLLAASIVGERGVVHAYDPSQTNCDLLRRSATENGFRNIDVRCKALADKVSQYAYFERDGNGVLGASHGDIRNVCGAVVTTTVLDTDLGNAPQIDVIKIDVEGAEHLAMLGAKALLTKHHPVILSEFSPKALEQVSRIAPEEYLEYMLGFGYSIFVLVPSQPPAGLGGDTSVVMNCWKDRKVDHINLMFVAAEPPPSPGGDRRKDD